MRVKFHQIFQAFIGFSKKYQMIRMTIQSSILSNLDLLENISHNDDRLDLFFDTCVIEINDSVHRSMISFGTSIHSHFFKAMEGTLFL
jgi:hypothetical protein